MVACKGNQKHSKSMNLQYTLFALLLALLTFLSPANAQPQAHQQEGSKSLAIDAGGSYAKDKKVTSQAPDSTNLNGPVQLVERQAKQGAPVHRTPAEEIKHTTFFREFTLVIFGMALFLVGIFGFCLLLGTSSATED
jgi:hypothetical protein